MRTFSKYFAAAAIIVFPLTVAGHPIPDLPVRTTFENGKTCRITVEVDIRCFTADPLNEPYLLNWVLEEMEAPERDQLVTRATSLLAEGIAFRFVPGAPLAPAFEFTFTAKDGKPLSKIDDPVMLTGTWQTPIPSGVEGYQVEALSSGRFDVVFRNTIDGHEVERFQVLFPGEKSYLLDIASPPPPSAPPATRLIAAPENTAPPAPEREPGFLPLLLVTLAIAGGLGILRHIRGTRGN